MIAVALLILALRTAAPGLPVALQPLYLALSLALSAVVGLASGITPAICRRYLALRELGAVLGGDQLSGPLECAPYHVAGTAVGYGVSRHR